MLTSFPLDGRAAAPLLCLPLLLGALFCPAGAIAAEQSPEFDAIHILQHRADEAASKNRLFKGLRLAEASKTHNQTLFDVQHYDMDLRLSPDEEILSGTVTTTATVINEAINTLDLDLHSNLTVLSATVAGVGTTFSHVGGLLTLDLDRPYTPGETVVVSVTYRGDPSGEAFGWDSHAGLDMIWTLSEPFGARHWWPCKDLNSDKAASMDIRVTVPDGLIVASNGLLMDDTLLDGWRTFHWQTNYPIVPYLVSLTVHPYTTFSHWYAPLDGGDPMEVQYFVYADHYDLVQSTYALTVPMIETFAQAYGEYPFVDEKYGHAEFNWGGGMEHQTLSSMGGWSEDLISHELGHQWWGDMVTCDDFGHIWLNEGFATWGEAYWAEQTYGADSYRQYMDFASYWGGGTIFVEDPQTDNIFSSDLSYNKASWVVHMLRGVLGDTDFFNAVQAYRAAFEYDSATTEDLQAVFETVSGRDLNGFFQQWIYGAYFPVYEYSWHAGPGDHQLTLTIDQIQTDTGLFTMPITVRVTTDQGVQDLRVENNLASETYVLDVDGVPEALALDPDHWILRQTRSSVNNPTFTDGILLVNGVDINGYDEEILTAYADSLFTGDQPFDFWDCFAAYPYGYPTELPTPLGHGSVPGDLLGRYSTVVWVGNNYNGDLAKWQETPIQSYLEAGGNVVLLSRRGIDFLDGWFTTYAGLDWTESSTSLSNCLATAPGLVDIPFIGAQTWNDVFATTVGPNSTLLFQETVSFGTPRGSGVLVVPPLGGDFRPDGGRLVHLAGRPYRMDHAALRQNMTHILETYLAEPYDSATPVLDEVSLQAPALQLGRNYPNPFNPATVLPFSLSRASAVELTIYDTRGRQVRTLVADTFAAGNHEVVWNGLDDRGQAVASGHYFARMKIEGQGTVSRAMVLVR